MTQRIVTVQDVLDTSGGSGDLWEQMLPGAWRLDRKHWHDAEVVQVYKKSGQWYVESRTHSPVPVSLEYVRRLLWHAVAWQDAMYAV